MTHPRHPKSNQFNTQGLFTGVQSFYDLEARIAALPTEQAKGAAFEAFAEACMATQRIYQAREVWPGNSMPFPIRKQLRLPISDMGVDGVFISPTDEAVCYQCKFRSGRPPLSWTELSTFYGLADYGVLKLIFTNCEVVSRIAEERSGAIFVRGGDLDRLTSEDFRVMEAWYSGNSLTPRRKSQRPHQKTALSDIVGGLMASPRVTALMACGSGKTLVALWVAERLKARSVLVLLPSLALVRQTLHEWLHETNWSSVEFLCVCSDPTVQSEEDSLLVRPSELDFAVTTQSCDVRRFLSRSTDAVKLVFSTYQSSQVLASAISGLPPFDLGVFDEAHKTAGRDGAKFSLALKDENVPIARRLFMTATPRHYDVAKKDKFGESKVVFSMDAPDVYGKVVHRLPFSEAVQAGVVTSYRVVISVVTSEMVTDEALRRGVVLIEGDAIKARQVANQIALKSAIEKYGVSKIFTFHSKVKSARSFTSDGSEGIGMHLDGFSCGHIEGAMTTAHRERLLRDFAAAPRAILSNARCLTEGVDVPGVDMVAFLSPKRSLVDIVQAAGRAMRLSPETEKKCGYVLVPLYVEKARGETIEHAVLRSNFDEIWKVLQGLKEQDDLLAQIISAMRSERGRVGGYDDGRFRERVEILGPELELETLRKTITAACVDAIGDKWFERYGQLVAYKIEFGNCDMPARWPANQKLATWVVDQRVRKRDGNLEHEKVDLLNRLNFNWNPRETNWRGVYLELVAFHRRFDHCRVPEKWKENVALARWVKHQRRDFANGELRDDRIALLEKIGFEWRVDVVTWDERFAQLRAFKERFGHTRVKVKWPENPLLGGWVSSQRGKYRKGEMSEAHANQLNSIGFEWDGRIVASKGEKAPFDRDKHWRKAFERFKIYAASHPVDVIKVVDQETGRLNRWMLTQRQARKKGTLSGARIEALDAVGFVWQRNKGRSTARGEPVKMVKTPILRPWNEMYRDLADFFKLHGHCNVTDHWSTQPELAQWVDAQRRSKKLNQLTSEQIDRMDGLGFAWTTFDGGWDAMFTRLVEYMRPMNNGKNREAPASEELKRWMLTQRQAKKRGDLDPERERRLNGIRFVWDPLASRWERMYAELQQFRAENGHCRVPAGWKVNRQLANWVAVQRRKFKTSELPEERTKLLERIGFDWIVPTQGGFSALSSGAAEYERRWQSRFAELALFKEESGNCRVPSDWPPNTQLAKWVQVQRQRRKQGKLLKVRIEQLNSIGFDWVAPRSSGAVNGGGLTTAHEARWDLMIEKLRAYKLEFGNCLVSQGWKKDKSLADWVTNVRMANNRGQLAADRLEQLDEMGFDWDPMTTRWEEMFQQLVKFKEEHGHTKVPQGVPRHRELATWVRNQRAAKQQKRPKFGDREIRLNAIGFTWRVVEKDAWEQMFEHLVAFKNLHGHCNVPQKSAEDKRLGKWVNTARWHRKQGKLGEERIRRLDSIGFVWNTRVNV